MAQPEPLIYSIEWDEQEKRFYMYGDEEFPNFSPFKVRAFIINSRVILINLLLQSLIFYINTPTKMPRCFVGSLIFSILGRL